MSGSTGQIIGTLVGGIVGAFIPGGYVMLGASIGGMIGGAIDPPKGPKIEGPRLSDLSQQTSSFGTALPRIYGACAVHGNVFWIENNALKEVSSTESSGGKGGGGSEVTQYSYFATFGLALCEGEIAGIRRIWINGKLFYDAGSSDLGTIHASNAAAGGFTVYRGTPDQQPDPRMQATVGVANTPGYRNTAWILFEDLPLADYGNTIVGAQIKVEVLSVASSSIQRIVYTAPYYTPNNAEIAFSPQPIYVGIDKTIFAAPQWREDYPATSSYRLYEMYPDGTTIENGSVDCSGGTVPPNQHSKSGYFLDAATRVFAANDFDSTKGFISEAPNPEGGNLYAGISNVGSLKIYVSTGNPSSQISIAAVAGDASIVTDGTYVYVSGSASTRKYDAQLNLITTGAGVANQTIAISRLCIDARTGYLCLMARVGTRTDLHKFSYDLTTATLVADWLVMEEIGYYNANLFVDGNIMIVATAGSPVGAYPTGDALYGYYWNLDVIDYATVTLDEIVLAESLKSKVLDAGDFNVTSLTDVVTGFRVSSMAAVPIRSGLEPLQASWPFDSVPSGYQIKYVRRGVNSSVATIDATSLDARPAGAENGVMLKQSREMDLQLPWRVEINHIDFGRDYDVGTQYAERLNTDSVNELKLELAIVMTADEAAQKAEILLHAYWLERNEFAFTLPPVYSYLEPADIITLNTANGTYVVRLTGLQYRTDGVIECTARFNDATGYTSAAVGANSAAALPSVIQHAGPVVYELLDVPVLKDAYDLPSYLAAMSSKNTMWKNGLIYRSIDNGQNWAFTNGFADQSKIGFCKNSITAPITFALMDKSSVLNAYIYVGTLSSVSELQLFAGSNCFAYGRDGRWEIIGAQSVSMQSDDSYNLFDMLRGRFGTEWAAGLHAVGDHIVLLDEATLQLVAMNSGQIGLEYLYRGIPDGGDLTAAANTAFSYGGVNLKPLSPVYAGGYRNVTSGDWIMTCIRRARVGGELRDGVDASLGEASENYEWDIYTTSGFTTIKRTVTSTTPTITYTSAQQIADFGSVQLNIYGDVLQMSSTVGRGYPLRFSLSQSPGVFAEIYADNPVGFWPLIDVSGSTCHADVGTDATITGSDYTRATASIGSYPASTTFTVRTSDTRIVTPITSNYAAFTVEVIFNADSLANSQELISKGSYYATATADFPFHLQVNSDGSLQANIDSGNDFSADVVLTTSTGLVTAGTSYHVAYVHRNSGLCEIYLDGTQVASTTIAFAIASNARAFTFAAPAFPYSGGANTFGFQGKMVGAAVFNTALSASRIAAHADLIV